MKNDKKKQIPLEKVKTIILSVIVSIILWVAIINVVNPDVTETIYNIPIATTGLSELREKGFVMTNTDSLPQCNVKVRGKRKNIIESKDKITAVINISDFNKSGEILAAVNINSPTGISVERQSVTNVIAQIENGYEKQIPIVIKQENVPYDKVIESKAENEDITIFGSKEDVDKIGSCRVTADVSGISIGTKASYPFVYLSNDNKEIEKPKTVHSNAVNLLIGHTAYDKAEVSLDLIVNDNIYKEYRLDTKEATNKKVVCGIKPGSQAPEKISYKLDEVQEGENTLNLADKTDLGGIYIPKENNTIKIVATKLISDSVPVEISAYNVKEGFEVANIKKMDHYVITATEEELKNVKGRVNVADCEDGIYSLPIEFENENIKNQYSVIVEIKRKGA